MTTFIGWAETSQMQDKEQEYRRGPYVISSDRARLNLEATLHLLHSTHWGSALTMPVLELAIANSICLGVYYNGQQIGFGRVISDLATYAYLTDFVIDEEHRGKGLGRWLTACVLAHPNLQGLRRIALVTRNARRLYEPLGFREGADPLVYMELRSSASKL